MADTQIIAVVSPTVSELARRAGHSRADAAEEVIDSLVLPLGDGTSVLLRTDGGAEPGTNAQMVLTADPIRSLDLLIHRCKLMLEEVLWVPL